MLIAIPLGEKPSWRSPPWVTLLLILANCWVFFAWQAPEQALVDKLAAEYAHTPLPPIEAAAFVRQLDEQARQSGQRRQRERAEDAARLVDSRQWRVLYVHMWHDPGFRQRLLNDQVIRPGSPEYDHWREARNAFTP
ncbi:hypothetical protein [Ottowia sp.]|uniref:hypothetical protein n=1 Tax=Ottowia sp. TaxID=1898956 RepID=UPI003A87FD50